MDKGKLAQLLEGSQVRQGRYRRAPEELLHTTRVAARPRRDLPHTWRRRCSTARLGPGSPSDPQVLGEDRPGPATARPKPPS
ncbi:hypothetical protein LB505_007539 [Fusarium chuoi]|nr:hypothetical protein LB505_007539 [Fusarium chuoi]